MNRKEHGVVLPVTVDDMPGRAMRSSYLERELYRGPKTNNTSHLLAPTHTKKFKPLPF